MTLRSQVVEFDVVCMTINYVWFVYILYISYIYIIWLNYSDVISRITLRGMLCLRFFSAYLRLRTEDLAQSGLVVCWSSEIHLVEPPQRKKKHHLWPWHRWVLAPLRKCFTEDISGSRRGLALCQQVPDKCHLHSARAVQGWSKTPPRGTSTNLVETVPLN